jgi:hypothetical protein
MISPDQPGSVSQIVRGTNQSYFPKAAHRAIAAPIQMNSVYLRDAYILPNQVKGHAAKANIVQVDQRGKRTAPVYAMQMPPLPSVQLHCDIGVMFDQQFLQAMAQGIFDAQCILVPIPGHRTFDGTL